MESLFAALFVVAICSVAISALSKAKTGAEGSRGKSRAASLATDSNSAPYSRRKYFFSSAERSFYEILTRLLPRHTVFAKVRLADVICVSKGVENWQSHFNRIRSKHVDFLVCDKSLAPVLAVELDDSSHDREDRKERDVFVDAALAAAVLPIIHIRAKRAYVLSEIRAALAPHLEMGPPPLPARELQAARRGV